MSREIEHFRLRKVERKKIALWRRIPNGVWSVLGEVLIKVAGEHIKGKVAKIVVVGVIAAAAKVITGDEYEDAE